MNCGRLGIALFAPGEKMVRKPPNAQHLRGQARNRAREHRDGLRQQAATTSWEDAHFALRAFIVPDRARLQRRSTPRDDACARLRPAMLDRWEQRLRNHRGNVNSTCGCEKAASPARRRRWFCRDLFYLDCPHEVRSRYDSPSSCMDETRRRAALPFDR